MLYAANNVNEYCYMTIGSVTNYMTYDFDGNQLTNGKGWSFKWNGENRLSSASNEEFFVSFAYDHQGRLVSKNVEKVDSANNDVEQYRKFQFWNDYNIVSELTIGNGYTNSVQNVWGPDLSGFIDGLGGIGGLLMVVSENEIYTPCYDSGGNIRSYINQGGETVAAKSYSPFGVIIGSDGPKVDLFTHWWSTKPYCSLLDLVEYEFRMYSPEMGRWTSRDPVDETSEFFFIDNDPVNNCDILGLANNSSGEQCFSIESKNNYDYRIKPLKSKVLNVIKNFKVEGQLNAYYSLSGERCRSCCMSGPFQGQNRFSGDGTVTLGGRGSLDVSFGKEMTSALFWEKYKFYLFAGIGINFSITGEGTGGFQFDGCTGEGSLDASLTDTFSAELRGGVEGWLKKRKSRGGKGGPRYDTVGAVSALLKGSLDSGIKLSLSCGMDTCTLSSYVMPVTGRAWIEGSWKKRTFKADLFESQTITEGTEIDSVTFDSPLKAYGQ